MTEGWKVFTFIVTSIGFVCMGFMFALVADFCRPKPFLNCRHFLWRIMFVIGVIWFIGFILFITGGAK